MKRIILLLMLFVGLTSFGQNGTGTSITNGLNNQVEGRRGGIFSYKYQCLPWDAINPTTGANYWIYTFAPRQDGRVLYDSVRHVFSGKASGTWKDFAMLPDLISYMKWSDTLNKIATKSQMNAINTSMSNMNLALSGKLNIVDTMPLHNEILALQNSKLTKPNGLSSQRLNGLGVPVTDPAYLQISDTSTFAKKTFVNNVVGNKLNSADTAIFARKNQLPAKLNVSDTTVFARKTALAIANSAISGKLNISDTSALARKANVNAQLATKQNNITLTTTGSGNASLVGSNLNIPPQSPQNITLSGAVSGSGTTNISTTLSATGVTPGTYGLVTVGADGRVISGKRQQPYSGVTASGSYTVTFATPYSVPPNIQANIIGGTAKQFTTITVSTTGFTVVAYQLNNITLSPLINVDVLLSSTTVVNGANIDVLVTEK